MNGRLSVPPLDQGAIHRLAQKSRPSQPALGLDEIEKEDAGELEQREGVAVLERHARRQRIHHAEQDAPEAGKEALVHPSPRECFRDAEDGRERQLSGARRAAQQPREVELVGLIEGEGEGGRVRRGYHEPAARLLEREHCRRDAASQQGTRHPFGGPVERSPDTVPLEFTLPRHDDGHRYPAKALLGQLAPHRSVAERLGEARQIFEPVDRTEQVAGSHRASIFAKARRATRTDSPRRVFESPVRFGRSG